MNHRIEIEGDPRVFMEHRLLATSLSLPFTMELDIAIAENDRDVVQGRMVDGFTLDAAENLARQIARECRALMERYVFFGEEGSDGCHKGQGLPALRC